MSNQITTAFVNQYKSNVQLLVQQKMSKFTPCVLRETQHAEYAYYDQIGPVSAQPRGARHSDTPLMETPHARRRVGINPYDWGDLIDRPDMIRTLIEPTSAYATNAVMAFNRRKDDIIIEAAFGTSYTGKDGSVTVPFPATQVLADGGEGLTVEKLIEARTMLWNHDIDEDEPIFIACSPASIAALLADQRVSSADYNTVKALVQGEINTFMGFNFIRTNRLPSVASGADVIRDNLIWVRDGLLVAVGEDIQVEIGPRADKRYSTQVYVSMDMGATRMDEKKVIKLQTLEAAAPAPAP
jgi:hypothetical protein